VFEIKQEMPTLNAGIVAHHTQTGQRAFDDPMDEVDMATVCSDAWILRQDQRNCTA